MDAKKLLTHHDIYVPSHVAVGETLDYIHSNLSERSRKRTLLIMVRKVFQYSALALFDVGIVFQSVAITRGDGIEVMF